MLPVTSDQLRFTSRGALSCALNAIRSGIIRDAVCGMRQRAVLGAKYGSSDISSDATIM